jgi:uncharacterized membrane protein YfcA
MERSGRDENAEPEVRKRNRRRLLWCSSSALCVVAAALSSNGLSASLTGKSLPFPALGHLLQSSMPILEDDDERLGMKSSKRMLEDAANGNTSGQDDAQQDESQQVTDDQAGISAQDQDDDSQTAGDDDQKQTEEEEHRGPDQDDWFRDGFADDTFTDDDAKNRYSEVDDFYAYVGDPRPPKLMPLSSREVIGYSVVAMALTLGASGGIGGGGVVVPVYLLVMGLHPHYAIPIASVTVFGGALASTIVNMQRRHPLADRPIIDWDLVLMMEPLTLIGTLLGTLFHRILSEKILIVLLVLLLSITAHSTLSKAMRMYEAEKRYIRHLIAAQADSPRGNPSLGGYVLPFGDEDDSRADTGCKEEARMAAEERQRILILNPDFRTMKTDLLEQEKVTPRSKIIALCCMFSVLIFLNLMVGGGSFDSPWDIKCGSTAFWVVHVVMIAFLMSSAWMAQTYLIARHEIKDMVRFDYVHGDIKWDTRTSIIYPAVFTIAGVFAGMFGIGGGVVIVPLLLHSGVHPGVA